MMDATTTTWNSQDHGMPQGPDDDFQQLFDMSLEDGLNFDFGEFQSVNGQHVMAVPQREPIDTPMGGTDAPGLPPMSSTAVQHHMPPMTTAAPHSSIASSMMSQAAPSNAISEIDAQIQYLQHQRAQRQLEEERQAAFFAQQSRMVPPTPQSLELQAGTGNHQFYSHPEQASQQRAMYDHFRGLKEQQDMSFTPLVSPAVTPLETHFSVDTQFTVPGAYFSPLTSPALHAQNDATAVYDPRLPGATMDSPVEVDLGPSSSAPPSGTMDLARKVRKNTAAKTRAKAGVRQSPISKPQRRKPTSTPVMTGQALSELAESAAQPVEQAQHRQTQQLAPQPGSSTSSSMAAPTESENGSISPEALSDMPPPPLPQRRSTSRSPFIQPQTSNSTSKQPGQPSPATPASLMKLCSPSANGAADHALGTHDISEHIASFELPESVTSASYAQPTQNQPDAQTPTQSANEVASSGKGSAFQPLPSPVFPKRTGAASQSPQLASGDSTPNLRKTPQIAARNGKKRASISSSHASPALRPKISPNIKPRMPGSAAMSAGDTTSQLLASKSNYQRILEGSTVPGVSYPSELSTNLTSKRTSHKIAEQGRRNRINLALQEMAALLPKSATEGKICEAEESPDPKKDPKQANGPNSKASTVELAIMYIKQLQQSLDETTKRAEEAEKKLGLTEEPS